jgi:transcriptional regulator with XRE-family HTH domain
MYTSKNHAVSRNATVGSLLLSGTGSQFYLSRFSDWQSQLEHRTPLLSLVVNRVSATKLDAPQHQDVRTAVQHLENIRKVINPAITDLASMLDVSRQAVYKWLGDEAQPELDKLLKIRQLSEAADAFNSAGAAKRASALVKMKAFDGRSLMELISTGTLTSGHTDTLIKEAKAMESAYEQSKLAKSKAKPTTDWQSELSIPHMPD